ncbi:MAG: translation initiation factor IF-2 [Lachnospiraceae bacterium]|nr:translation initiation factor IF-2 [Lachnospiraceae bacterium]
MAENKEKDEINASKEAEAPKKKKMTVVFRTQNSAQNSLKSRGGVMPPRPAARPGINPAAQAAKAAKAAAARAAEEEPVKKVVKRVVKKAVAPEHDAIAAEEPAKKAAAKEADAAETAEVKKTAKKKVAAKAAETETPVETTAEESVKKTAAKKTKKAAETEVPAETPAEEPEKKPAAKKTKKAAEPEPEVKKPEKPAPAPRFVDMAAVRAATNRPKRPSTSSAPAAGTRGPRTGQPGAPRTGAGTTFVKRQPGQGPARGQAPQGGRNQGGGFRAPAMGAYEMAMQKPGKGGKNARGQGNRFDKKNSDELKHRGVKVSNKSLVRTPQKPAEPEEPQIKTITIPEVLTIKDLADAMKIQAGTIIKKLFMKGQIFTVNDEIDYETAENIAVEFDVLCEKEIPVDVIAELLEEKVEDSEEDMVSRPPVVCVMGHVDHGKTSLLDAIRKTNVISKEAGGITQAIGAYMVEINGRKITFLDTPGHEAFTAMRMRGAQATDIAILVVAADDGVMPQTVEAINHAKAAGVEIIVAINKIDKPGADINRVKQELTEYELIDEEWGGSTTMVPISAKTGEGISDLLEMVLLEADVLELRANPGRNARGLVIEAQLDKGRGPVATVLVQKGTLKVGDTVAAGTSFGKIRAMIDDKGQRVKKATPSMPVEILGLNDVPNAGEIFVATDSEKDARSFAETFIAEEKKRLVKETKSRVSLDDIFEQIKEGELKELNIIVKADVQGSVEAVKTSLIKLSNDEVVVKVIHSGAGNINESDVTLASASNAIIIGFNVKVDPTAKNTAETDKVDIRLYDVIYKAIEDVEAAMKGMLDPVFEERIIGHAVVRQTFKASQIGVIAGSFVLDGKIVRGCKCRITRDGEQIFDGNLASLKRFKDDVKEVRDGYECGLVFDGWSDLAEEDQIEAYEMVEVAR